LDAGEAVAGTLFVVFAAVGGLIARKIWIDPGYAQGMIDRGPVGWVYSGKTWRGGVRGILPVAIWAGLAGLGLFALGPAGNVRPDQSNAADLVGAACILLSFVCLGCHVTIIWFNRPQWLVPPHMRQDVGNVTAWWDARSRKEVLRAGHRGRGGGDGRVVPVGRAARTGAVIQRGQRRHGHQADLDGRAGHPEGTQRDPLSGHRRLVDGDRTE
jgi:hypothetical protein